MVTTESVLIAKIALVKVLHDCLCLRQLSILVILVLLRRRCVVDCELFDLLVDIINRLLANHQL